MEWFFIILTGALIGTVLGLVGVGGGILFAPMAVHFLHYSREEAMGLALLVICLASASSAIHSWKEKDISWMHIALYLSFAPLASFTSAHYATLVPTTIRLWLFISLLFLAGLSMLFSPTNLMEKPIQKKSYYVTQICIATFIGSLAGLLGIGAGFLFVPTLYYWSKLDIKKAIASSLVIVSVSSAGGFIGAYFYLEESQTRWLPVLGVIITSISFSLFLSRWRSKLPKRKIQILFCGILWMIASLEIVKALTS